MVLLMILISRVGADRKPWRELSASSFRIRCLAMRSWPEAAVGDRPGGLRRARGRSGGGGGSPEPAEYVPDRTSLVDFPMILGNWFGERRGMTADVIQALKLNGLRSCDYRGPASRPVNLYVAWYDSQRPGRSVHSPSVCIPAGGWKITEIAEVEVAGVQAAGQPLRVNRAIIERGSERQLVYYWLQQRGRIITNEYLGIWYSSGIQSGTIAPTVPWCASSFLWGVGAELQRRRGSRPVCGRAGASPGRIRPA